MNKVYLSPSLQEHNVGVGKYGTEMDRMFQLAASVKKRLVANGYNVRVAAKAWGYLDPNTSLAKVVNDSNAWGAEVHICLHTNAGPKTSGGTMTMYYPGSVKGRNLATAIHKRVAVLSPGQDIGIVTQPVFYETREAHAPVAYCELFFHTNLAEVNHFLAHVDAYGKAVADGIMAHFGDVPAPVVIKVPVPERKPSWWSAMLRWLRLRKKGR